MFLGILSSITCQGVSGNGSTFGGKGGYIYIEDGGQSNENIGHKEAEGEEEVEGKKGSLVSRVKNKLKQAKDFVSQNPVKAGAVGLAAAATPVLAYTGYKIKQHYFGEKDVDLAKDVQTDEENKGAEVNKEVPGSDKVSENKEVATNLPVNEENPPEGQGSGEETKSPVETEQSKPIGSNKEIDEKTKADSNKVDPASGSTELDPSANANIENEAENADENLKSVYFGVYSEPIIYLLLKLTPQSWGLQDWWYNLWHYKNGRFSHPFKLIFAVLCWMNIVAAVIAASNKFKNGAYGKGGFLLHLLIRNLIIYRVKDLFIMSGDRQTRMARVFALIFGRNIVEAFYYVEWGIYIF